jgi:uncharacterized iron-regulated protein
MGIARRFVLVVTALLAAGPAAAQEHPLSGRIWHVAEERFLAEDELIAALSRARFVLVGESHDNPDHHQAQAYVIERLVRAGRRPIVAFEQMDATQQAALDRYLSTRRTEGAPEAQRDAAGLGRAIGWSNVWPEWRFYEPIAEAALRGGLALAAANLPDELVRRAMRDMGALDAAFAARTHLAEPLPEPERRMLERELVVMHCGTTGPLIEMMITAQRVRDAALADALLRFDEGAMGGDGGVLIAGTGHTRSDRGVPWVLGKMAPERSVASLAMVEVAGPFTRPQDYARLYDATRLPFDYVWFMPAATRGRGADPCR